MIFIKNAMPNNDAIKLVCVNPDCINKSEVWRKYTTNPEWCTCRKCGSTLRRVGNKKHIKQDQKAKNELKEFGL